MLKNAPERSLN